MHAPPPRFAQHVERPQPAVASRLCLCTVRSTQRWIRNCGRAAAVHAARPRAWPTLTFRKMAINIDVCKRTCTRVLPRRGRAPAKRTRCRQRAPLLTQTFVYITPGGLCIPAHSSFAKDLKEESSDGLTVEAYVALRDTLDEGLKRVRASLLDKTRIVRNQRQRRRHTTAATPGPVVLRCRQEAYPRCRCCRCRRRRTAVNVGPGAHSGGRHLVDPGVGHDGASVPRWAGMRLRSAPPSPPQPNTHTHTYTGTGTGTPAHRHTRTTLFVCDVNLWSRVHTSGCLTCACLHACMHGS